VLELEERSDRHEAFELGARFDRVVSDSPAADRLPTGFAERRTPLRRHPIYLALGLAATAGPALAQEFDVPSSENAVVFVAPCRLVDTRSSPPAVPFGGPALAPGVTRSFAAVGNCAIPAGAAGVQLYVTVTTTAGAGYLRVGPTGAAVPAYPSLNYDAAGRTLGVPVATTLGSGSFDVTAYVSTTHVIVDVVGYYSNAVVSSLNGETGAVDIVGGTNVTVTKTAGTLTLDAPLTTGPEGPIGPAGPAGATGAAGPQGPEGATGAQGPPGATGPAGPQGVAGATGPAGPLGPTGAGGATGVTGAQGPVGATGPAGPAGPAGATGAAGPQGATGLTGATGAAGATGPAGPAGPQGPTGATGPAGSAAVVKDHNGVTLGILLTQSGYGPTVITSTGYQVTVPWNGNLNSLQSSQIYFTSTDCTLGGTDHAWFNSGNTTLRPTQGKQAYWASSVGTYLVPVSVDANGVSWSGATSGVGSFLNGTCGLASSGNWGYEVRAATLSELGLPATIAAPLQMPTP
jgi:hypothetical protein